MCPCSRCLCANSDLLVRQPRGQWVPALRRSHVSSQQNTGQWVQHSGFRSHAVTFVFSQWTLWLTQCWAGYLHLVATWYLMPSQPWRLCLGETRSSESQLKVWFSVYDMHLFCLSEYDFDHKKKRERKRGVAWTGKAILQQAESPAQRCIFWMLELSCFEITFSLLLIPNNVLSLIHCFG